MSNLVGFVLQLDGDVALQRSVSLAQTPAEIVALAEARGWVVSPEELRNESRQLSASYWPWAGKGYAWRRSFFNA